MDGTETYIDEVINLAIRAGIAFGVMLLGMALARWSRRAMKRLVEQPRIGGNLSPSVRDLIVRLTYYTVVALAFGFALIAFGVPANYVLAGYALILLVLAVALQQSLANLTATIIFITYKPFRAGEYIQTMGYTGTVLELQLFNTVLVTTDMRQISLANSQIQQAGVVNYTRAASTRFDVQITLAYATDLDLVRRLLLDMVARDARVLKEPPPDVIVSDLSDVGVVVALRAFVPSSDYLPLHYALREEATATLVAAGIEFARVNNAVRIVGTGDVPFTSPADTPAST